MQLPNLSNSRIVKSREEVMESGVLVCNDPENQFNHVTRDDLYLGSDFEVVSKQMWSLL